MAQEHGMAFCFYVARVSVAQTSMHYGMGIMTGLLVQHTLYG